METTYNRIWERKLKTETEQRHKEKCKCRACEASRLFDGGQRFLDVGCGSGFLEKMLAQKYEEYYGVDISPIVLSKASEKGIKTVNADVNVGKLPFENGYFDSVACLDVIEHVLNPHTLLCEVNRVLRNRGFFVISAPNIRYWYHIMSLVVFGRFPKTSGDNEAYDGGHIHYFTRKDIENLLRIHGFGIVPSSFFRRTVLGDYRYPGITIKAEKLAATGLVSEQ